MGAKSDKEMRKKYEKVSFFFKCGACGRRIHNSACIGNRCPACDSGGMTKAK